jgi:hypothetical protein
MIPLKETDYCFVVLEEATQRQVEIDVREYDAKAQKHFQSVWQRLYSGLQGHHKICERDAPAWVSWKPWDWCQENKPGYEGRIKYTAWCGDIPVGFLNVWVDVPGSHAAGKNLLFLEHIASAPGNQTTEIWSRRFKAVGAALFAHVVLLSYLRGFEGRIGLHVADEEAKGFYRRLNEKCGNNLFQPAQTGIAGPTPRGEYDRSKTYLETTEAGAKVWLENYRRE